MLTPREIVKSLDKYIMGQDEAKRAVAVALRNRYRRSRLSDELREEITPKNIIMIGPTGVGKTEIARRLAKLVDAPFVKVEATKFTEVGYVGRDVDSMIRDLVDASIRLVKTQKLSEVELMAQTAAEQRLADALLPGYERKSAAPSNPFLLLMGAGQSGSEPEISDDEKQKRQTKREEVLSALRAGSLENSMIDVEVEESSGNGDAFFAMGMDVNITEMLGGLIPKKKKKRKMTVADARRIFVQEESEKLLDMDEVIRIALEKAEQDGIIFIDELDKVAASGSAHGPDVSREGVQRDILPIVEGSTVTTKYGPVKTDYILFIAAGAFHVSKVTDLIPELQGRFPIKVQLSPLRAEDFERILTEPENALTRQYAALLGADNIVLSFTDGAIKAIAKRAYNANESGENIGARRLHTIMETLLEDVSFNAGGDHPIVDVTVDEAFVEANLKNRGDEDDLNRYIL